MRVSVAPGLGPCLSNTAKVAASDRQFLSAGWYGGESGALATLSAIGNDGEALAALPLTGRWPFRWVPGSYWPFRSFPVAASARPEQLARLFREARRAGALGLAVRLGPTCEDDPALALLRQAVDETGYRLVERVLGRCFVHHVDDLLADGPWPHASAQRRNATRERQLAAHGPIRWAFVRGADWTGGHLDDLAAVERASWLGASGGDRKFGGESQRRHWRRLIADPTIAGHLSACLLYVGARPIAFSFDLDCGNTRFGICSGYDRAFHQQSPGRLLHYRNTADAIARGVRLINWGCGDSGYKRQLGAVPGPRLLDCLLVRDLPGLVPLARRLWTRAPGE